MSMNTVDGNTSFITAMVSEKRASVMPSWKKMAENFRSPRKVLRRLRYLPGAARKIRNWPSFIYHYALGLTPTKPYRFRNGAQLRIGRAIDHVPIIEIFLNQEYGLVPDNAVVLDLGANIGVFSIYATMTARNVQVYAYEPFHVFASLLRENVRLNSQSNAIRCFDAAVGAQSGNRSLSLGRSGFHFPTLLPRTSGELDEETITAQCTTLAQIIDDNQLAQVDLLKIDCEGAEFEILYATPASHLKKIRELRMEYHNMNGTADQLEKLEHFLADHGFFVTHRRAASAINGTLWMKRENASAGM